MGVKSLTKGQKVGKDGLTRGLHRYLPAFEVCAQWRGRIVNHDAESQVACHVCSVRQTYICVFACRSG